MITIAWDWVCLRDGVGTVAWPRYGSRMGKDGPGLGPMMARNGQDPGPAGLEIVIKLLSNKRQE